ncbi:MAG: 2-hydroxychromene-2-carboxylate isomerase [Pseudomonadota bacterium]
MPDIQYFYSTHSAYAYLGAKKLAAICATHDCRLIHRPFELSPAVEAAGGLPFAGRTQAHVDYFFGREIERWAAYRGLPVLDHRPTFHDAPLHLSSGLLIAAMNAGRDIDALSFALLQSHWRDDSNLSSADDLAKAASSIGIDAAALLDQAMSASVQQTFANNTAEAIDRSLFGSPTYILGDEVFYGQDRLELLEHALTTPFPKPGFRNPPVTG